MSEVETNGIGIFIFVNHLSRRTTAIAFLETQAVDLALYLECVGAARRRHRH
ncbi:hypothetical protein [Nostoc sp. C057]|uniref:hypothetical protein n=1 Tax=Nostoc sp. C057 TaxID=2576903 RepID=UPI0015C384C0|nr:hypothetical protein [Nostoc sp. C057]